jgi:8-oxo-dGTP pyrophosphatase MutT (NUDIX family)
MLGHTARRCEQPVTSYGVLCFRRGKGPEHALQYLMIQKKDSLGYVEFVRGKYSSSDVDYLIRLASNMTKVERRRLLSAPTFDDIWAELWTDNMDLQTRKFALNYGDARRKFDALREAGTLAHIIRSSEPGFDDSEWEFPKGRRHPSEHDLRCALREFTEETGVPASAVRILHGVGPFHEVFAGMNGVWYRHVYFLAELTDTTIEVHVDATNRMQACEVRDLAWKTMSEVEAILRPTYYERRRMLHQVDTWLSLNAREPSSLNVTPPPQP